MVTGYLFAEYVKINVLMACIQLRSPFYVTGQMN